MPLFTLTTAVDLSSIPEQPALFDNVGATSPFAPDCLSGCVQKISTDAASFTIMPPTNPVSGQYLTMYIDSTSEMSLTLDSAILIPNESTLASPLTLLAGKTYILQFRYLPALSAWSLSSFVGGYVTPS